MRNSWKTTQFVKLRRFACALIPTVVGCNSGMYCEEAGSDGWNPVNRELWLEFPAGTYRVGLDENDAEARGLWQTPVTSVELKKALWIQAIEMPREHLQYSGAGASSRRV